MSEGRSASRRAFAAGLLAAGAAPLVASPALAGRRSHADVLVLGAGLAGLHAATLLERAGLDVLVVEGLDRVGGRLQTFRDLPGQPNAGGVEIGAGYRRVRAAAARVGLAIRDPDGRPAGRRPRSPLWIDRTWIAGDGWETSSLNTFPANHRGRTPADVLMRLAIADNPVRAGDPLAWADPAVPDLSADAWLAAQGFDARSRALVDRGANANALTHYAMVNVWRTARVFEAENAVRPGTGSVVGGSQGLAEAMAAALARPPRLSSAIRRIDAGHEDVTVHLADGGQLRAAHAVCTLPFAALRRVRLSGVQAPTAQAQAISSLPYTQIVQIFIEPQAPFWERDGLGMDMWTDGPIERVFGLRDASDAPSGLLLAWINGEGCAAVPRRPEALQAWVEEGMRTLRPASEGRVRVRRVMRWTRDNPMAGGAYAHFAPGQIRQFGEAMGRPIGRMYLAGEHLSRAHTGMEGAMESAEFAAAAIAQALGRSIPFAVTP